MREIIQLIVGGPHGHLISKLHPHCLPSATTLPRLSSSLLVSAMSHLHDIGHTSKSQVSDPSPVSSVTRRMRMGEPVEWLVDFFLVSDMESS